MRPPPSHFCVVSVLKSYHFTCRRALRACEKKSAGTDASLTELQDKRTALKRRIETWQQLQDLHMPIVTQFRSTGDPSALASILAAQAARLNAANATSESARPAPPLGDQSTSGATTTAAPRTPANSSSTNAAPLSSQRMMEDMFAFSGAADSPSEDADANTTKAKHVRLWLPSALPAPLRASLSPGLADKKRRMRIAQADDALEDIRRLRRIITGIAEFKRLNIDGTGQRTTGKTRSLFIKFQEKIRRAAARYRAARAALESLDAGGQWQARFRVLLDSDLRGPGRNTEEHPSEGRYEISWIWLVCRGPGDASIPSGVETQLDPREFLENMKVEWARSQAHAERWHEEILLLEEEMRRVIEYFEWKATWWRQQASRRAQLPSALQRGLTAYAEYQASIFDRLASHCASLWIPYLRKRDRAMPGWAARYPIDDAAKKSKGKARHSMPSDICAGASASTAQPDDDSESESDASSSGSD